MPRTLPALVAALVLLGGCSSDGHKKKNAGSTVTVGHNQPIAFGAFEYRFEPKKGIPFPVFMQASADFPELRIEAQWKHDDVAGRAVIENGRLVEREIKKNNG